MELARTESELTARQSLGIALQKVFHKIRRDGSKTLLKET